jgi:hypothetical protein
VREENFQVMAIATKLYRGFYRGTALSLDVENG